MSLHTQSKAAPGPPPETWGAYSTKSEGNTGVISMIDLLFADLSKEMTEAKTDEKNSQANCGTMMTGSTAKRTTVSKALSAKGSDETKGALALSRQAGRQAGRQADS